MIFFNMNLYLQIFLHTLPTILILVIFLIKQEIRLARLEESIKWISQSFQNLPCVKDPKYHQSDAITPKPL